jgi:CheY-like chemotaxis protein
VEAEGEMVEQTPREYLEKILELSREMVGLASSDPGYELDVGCRMSSGPLRLRVLKKMARRSWRRTSRPWQLPSRSPLAADSSSPESPRTVLIVNDDPILLKQLALLFRDNGFEARTAVSPQEVMKAVHASRPDLIILDASMPGKRGASVYRDLKEDAELGPIPVVLLTAIGDSFGRFAERGGQPSALGGFVARPLDVDLLWEAVQEALRGRVRR